MDLSGKKVMIGVPNYDGLHSEFAVSLIHLVSLFQTKDVHIDTFLKSSSLINKSRNEIFFEAIKANMDYLLFLDADICFNANEIFNLFDLEKAVAGGMYFSKEPPYVPVVYSAPVDDREKFLMDTNIVKFEEPFACYGIGAGCMLIDMDQMNFMGSQEYINEYGMPFNMISISNGDQLGEDLSFCKRVNNAGFTIWCDPRIRIGHKGYRIIYKEHHFDYLLKNNMYSNDLEGWTTSNELNWLYQHAKYMKTIVEIGCWKGRSTHALLSGCRGTVYAVDHFMGSKDEVDGPHKEATERDIYLDFLSNVGKFKNLNVIKYDSFAASFSFVKDEVDMVFIDAGHTFDEICQDIDIWNDKCRKLICGHDYNLKSVYEAVNSKFKNVNKFESIWYVWKN